MSILFLAVVGVLACLFVLLIGRLPIEEPYRNGLVVTVLVAAILTIAWKLGAFKP